jgi:hypothetical protein
MRVDVKRVRQYLTEITRNSQELKKILEQSILAPDSVRGRRFTVQRLKERIK